MGWCVMLRVATLASGSSGNCTVVSDGRVHILIDAGISTRRIAQGLKALGTELRHVSGVLITHEHTDHVSALPVLCRQTGAALYTAEGTACELCGRWQGMVERFRVFEPGQRFELGGLEIGTFPTSHDCACPVGYWVTDGKRKVALCTDTGAATPQAREGVRGAHTLIGEWGHLSNQAGGELAAWAAAQGTSRVILAHLSAENNRPELALEAARKALGGLGLGEDDVELVAAPRSEATGWFEV